MNNSIVSEHWDNQYEAGVRSSWFACHEVVSELNRRITGSDKFWLTWFMTEYLQKKPDRVLSIGCGNGDHELLIARQKWCKHIEAFDASPAGIAHANSVAKEEKLNATFHVRDFDDFIRNPGKDFDLIIFIGSLHHVTDLEGMLGAVRKSLSPDGYVLINEYCGPCYNMYEDKRIEIINSLLASLSPIYKLHKDAHWINHSIESVMATDPSEAVRSELIPRFLDIYFEPELIRPFGGTLLHPMFDLLNSAKLNDGSEESKSVIRLLIEVENVFIRNGIIGSDFLFGAYRNK